MTLATAPNAAIPAGLLGRRKSYPDVKAANGHAAGIVFLAPDGDVLMLHRSRAEENFPGHWALPGGGVDEGETPEQGAIREAREEMGIDADPAALRDIEKTITPKGKAFHTYVLPVAEKFVPKLNGEHSGYTWAGLDSLPRPMHPAVDAMLKTRLGIGEDMSPGDWAGLREGMLKWIREEEREEIDHRSAFDSDDLDALIATDDWNEGDHPRASNGQFGSGGSSTGAHGGPHHVIHEKGDLRAKPSEKEAQMLGLKPKKPEPEDRSAHENKKGISTEALQEKLRGMPKAKLEAASKNKDIDPMIRAHVHRELTRRMMGSDSALKLALDKETVREKRKDGQLVVKRAHVTKANVCPYRGAEIPGWEELGLDRDAIYNLLRDPDELKKAAPTLNGVQLLRKHIPVNAEDHQPYDTVGSLGTDAEFVEEGGENYLDNSLFINAKDAIDGIESGKKRELSAGYHYTPDMTPGNFRGTRYDGVMRDIVFNHVALVEDGRAGPDVVVGDSMENLMAKPTKLGVHVLGMVAHRVAPLIAMDQKVVFPNELIGLFSGLTTKNFAASKGKLLDGVKASLVGKTRQGLAMDGPLEHLKAAVDAYEELAGPKADEPAPEEAQMQDSVEPIAEVVEEKKAFDSGQVAEFLRGKGMGEDDIKTVCDMFPKNMAGDEDDDGEKDKDKDMGKDTVSKQAMDEALKGQATAFEKQLKDQRENERGVRVALSTVRDWVGELPASMAFDTAADVYRHALVMKGVEGAKNMHGDALLPVLKTLPKIGAKTEVLPVNPVLAMDTESDAFKLAREIAPGLANISAV